MKRIDSQLQFTITINEDERTVLMGALAIGLERSPNNELAIKLLDELKVIK